MKKLKRLLKRHDALEERLRILTWARQVLLEKKLIVLSYELRERCGFAEAEPWVKERWLVKEAEMSIRDRAALLLQLAEKNQSISEFISDLAYDDGSHPWSLVIELDGSLLLRPEQRN